MQADRADRPGIEDLTLDRPQLFVKRVLATAILRAGVHGVERLTPSRARTSRSNTAGQKAILIGSARWPRTSSSTR
jgi:hypothetical protein